MFVSRIIKLSDQQASIFLQQKLKVADAEERAKIVDAICTRGFEMMAHRCVALSVHSQCLADVVFVTVSATGLSRDASKRRQLLMRDARSSVACGMSVVHLTLHSLIL